MRMSRRMAQGNNGRLVDNTDYTYTGKSTWINDGDNNWRLKFLTTGKFTPKQSFYADVFACGAGGGGGRGGGGGGYTTVKKNVLFKKGKTYTVTIGAGVSGSTGGTTTAAFETTVTAKGGSNGSTANSTSAPGGAGGSGGGAYVYQGKNGKGKGGSNGSAGGTGHNNTAGGTGQGTTTREFHESTGILYCGGGGGASRSKSYTPGAAGDETAGAGAVYNATPKNGVENRGGGGGAGGEGGTRSKGGSGIVILRNIRYATAN